MVVEVYGEAFKGYVVRGWWGCVYAGPDVGSYVVVDTAVGRLKERNTRRDPRVALAVLDWEDPYTYVEIRGRVVERITGPEAEEHIDKLAVKYTGEKFKWRQPGSRRIILKIKPEKIILG